MKITAALAAVAVLACGTAFAADPPATTTATPSGASATPVKPMSLKACNKQARPDRRSAPPLCRAAAATVKTQPVAAEATAARAPPRCFHFRRQLDHHPQAGLVVFEREPRAMQPRDRRDETQPEAAAVRPAALPDSHERLHGAHPVISRHTRTVIAHDQTDTICQALHAQIDAATRRNVFQTVLDEIRDQLGQQLAITLHDRPLSSSSTRVRPWSRTTGSNNSASSVASSPTSTAAG